MSEIRAVLWTGGDPPNRDAKLTLHLQWDGSWAAIWEPGYCGCPDCRPCIGHGVTKEAAILDYWDRWEERQP